MDVIVPFGINYKKCSKKSFSEYKRTQLFSYLEKNICDKNHEVTMALIAELHCSSYYNDITNFIIYFYSNYLILSLPTFSFFIYKYLQKISQIKSSIPKKYQNIALINSNEIRNIYCSIFSNFLNNKINKFHIKLEPKCHLDEYFLIHSNIQTYINIYDSKNVSLSNKLSRGIREILYWLDNSKLNIESIEKILYWIHWCLKIDSMEKKVYKGVFYSFSSNFSLLDKIKNKNGWEFFIWDKIFQKSFKNKNVNKILIRSLCKLFFHNYSKNKLKERSNIIAIAIIIANHPYKLKIQRNISKNEIFTSINANNFYKNIQIDTDNDEKYLEYYNDFNNIKSKDKLSKIYKINKMEQKMDFLKDYIPKETQKKHNNVSDYFS